MYAVTQVETLGASRKVRYLMKKKLHLMKLLSCWFVCLVNLCPLWFQLNELTLEELMLQEQETKGSAEIVTEKREAAPQRSEAKEKDKVEESSLVVAAPKLQYQEFTWEDIVTATSSFSQDLKIGMGAYGDVYKCNLHHTIAAVKVLHSAEINLSKQFDQEVRTQPNLVSCFGSFLHS